MSDTGVMFAGVLAERVRQEAMVCLDAGAVEAGACLFTLADHVDGFNGSSSELVNDVHGYVDRYAALLWEDETGQFQSLPVVVDVCLEDAVHELLNMRVVA